MTKQIGKNVIQFKHVRTNPIHNTPAVVMVVLNALNYLGNGKIDDVTIKRCSKILNDSDKKYLQKMSSRVSGWVSDFIPKIIAE